MIIITSCSRKVSYPWEIGNESLIEISSGVVDFSLEEGSLSSGGGSFVLKNRGKTEIMYGADINVQLRKGRRWYDIDVKRDFIAIGFFLSPGEKVILDIDWSVFYGNLPEGNYRLIKGYRDNTDTTKLERFVAAEFEIE